MSVFNRCVSCGTEWEYGKNLPCPKCNPAPAPSDVKGEESTESDTNGGGKRIKSDTKLTPLTDPSVYAIPDGGERIKELEAELAKRTQERDEAVPFMAALKGRHNGYDPGNSKIFPAGPPATPEVALNELIEEQEWLVNSELRQAQSNAERLEADYVEERRVVQTFRSLSKRHESDAERLRKAIGEAAYTLATGGFAGAIAAQQMLLAALTPSPAAGEKSCQQPESSRIAQNASATSQETKSSVESVTAASDNSPSSESKTSGTTKTSTTTPPTCEPSPAAKADTQGNAQHHSEVAKIPEGGSGSSAAESEGRDPIIRVERIGEVSPEQLAEWQRHARHEMVNEKNRYKAECKALSARLAACEERCRELEAGIEKHQRQHQAIYDELDGAEKFDKELWSLLAPKAGGEAAVV